MLGRGLKSSFNRANADTCLEVSLGRVCLFKRLFLPQYTQKDLPVDKPWTFFPQLPTICHGQAALDESTLLPCPIWQLVTSPIPYQRHLLLLLKSEEEIAIWRSHCSPVQLDPPKHRGHPYSDGLGLLPQCLAQSPLT